MFAGGEPQEIAGKMAEGQQNSSEPRFLNSYKFLGHPLIKDCGIALFFIAAVVCFQWAFPSIVGPIRFLFIYPALFIVSQLVRFWVSLLTACIFTVLAGYYLTLDHIQFQHSVLFDSIRLSLFLALSISVIFVSKRARARADSLKQVQEKHKELQSSSLVEAHRLEAQVDERTRALRARENQLQLALKSSSSGTWYRDFTTQNIVCDDATLEVFGRTRESFAKTFEGFLEYVHPEDRPLIILSSKRAAESGEEINLEYRAFRADGNVRNVEARGKPVRNESGIIVGMTGLVSDITDRRMVEITRLKMEQTFSAVLDSVADSLILFNHNALITHVNRQTVRLLGYEDEELVGQRVEILIPPEYLSDFTRLMEELKLNPEPRTVGRNHDLFAQKKSGERIPVELSLSPAVAHNERFTVCLVRDISEQKVKEAKMRMMLSLVESSGDLISVCEVNGKPIFMNPAGRAMVGIDKDADISAVNILDVLVPEDVVSYQSQLTQNLANNRSWSGECRLRHCKTHAIIPTQINAFPIPDEHGKVIAYGSVGPNLSVMKSKEEELRKALEEKEVLLREIHHRVKNNLNVVASLLDLQFSGTSDPETRTGLLDAKQRIGTMALIHETLYRAHNFASINFGEYIQELVRCLYISYGKDPAQYGTEVIIENVFLGMELATPCSLLINELVTNALKYAFKGREQGKLLIRLHPAGSLYELEVSDDGVGMPPDFDLEKCTTLGLRMVSTLSHQMGGDVVLRKRVANQGAHFTVHFNQYSNNVHHAS